MLLGENGRFLEFLCSFRDFGAFHFDTGRSHRDLGASVVEIELADYLVAREPQKPRERLAHRRIPAAREVKPGPATVASA